MNEAHKNIHEKRQIVTSCSVLCIRPSCLFQFTINFESMGHLDRCWDSFNEVLADHKASTHNGQETHTNTHAQCGVRTHDTSIRVVEYVSNLRSCGHCDGPKLLLKEQI
jgi:hypothetical protein